MLFKPDLRVVGEPIINSVKINVDTYRFHNMRLESLLCETLNVYCFLEISSELVITNVGTSLARLYAVLCSDTLSGDINIRKKLIAKNEEKLHLTLFPIEDYYKTKEIPPNDTFIIEFKQVLQCVSEGKFTLHYFILYDNEIGSLYDRYYWARYHAREYGTEPKTKTKVSKNGFTVETKFSAIYPKDHLIIVNSNSSAYTYSLREAKIVKDLIKSTLKNSK